MTPVMTSLRTYGAKMTVRTMPRPGELAIEHQGDQEREGQLNRHRQSDDREVVAESGQEGVGVRGLEDPLAEQGASVVVEADELGVVELLDPVPLVETEADRVEDGVHHEHQEQRERGSDEQRDLGPLAGDRAVAA